MDGLALATATTTSTPVDVGVRCRLTSYISPRRRKTRRLSLPRKSCKLLVFASKDDPKLDPWDQMELKFGQLLGEDPKLTLAKIMGRKSDPDASYLAIEKSFYNKKGELADGEVEEVSFDQSRDVQSSTSLSGLNLVRPMPKKGVKFETEPKPAVSEVRKPSEPLKKPLDNSRSSIPNVILRKPTTYVEDDVGPSKLRMKPNLSFRLGNEQKREKFSDITLLKKPEPLTSKVKLDDEQEQSIDSGARVVGGVEDDSVETTSVSTKGTNGVTIRRHPERIDLTLDGNQQLQSSDDNKLTEDGLENAKQSRGKVNTVESNVIDLMESLNASPSRDPGQEDETATGLQPFEQRDLGSFESSDDATVKTQLVDSDTRFSMVAALQGKPKRLDQSVKGTSENNREDMDILKPASDDNTVELQSLFATSPIKEHEDTDWSRAAELIRTGGREDVELISASTRGFVVSFGSLIGFLPYRNLQARWKFLAFESWLRKKGLDPSKYRPNLGIIANNQGSDKTLAGSALATNIDCKVVEEISPDMKLDDLLRIYDQEKLEFLSSFVGQRIKVNMVLADRKSRKLIFSLKPKEKDEMVEKKRSLMAQLSVGDIVKCGIKKITYFGIFVEIDGVPALIHQTEVSWDATLDPASYFKVGQIVEAKVHQLDFSLERIFLSLKEITPDPLIEALEAVIGDHSSLDGRLEAAQADTEWTDVESLITELQKFEGIQSVSKGRFFLSPGLAPTFQVYMASMFENQYKLLARAGNRVQEVIVETSLGKEELKTAIMTCTNRVE